MMQATMKFTSEDGCTEKTLSTDLPGTCEGFWKAAGSAIISTWGDLGRGTVEIETEAGTAEVEVKERDTGCTLQGVSNEIALPEPTAQDAYMVCLAVDTEGHGSYKYYELRRLEELDGSYGYYYGRVGDDLYQGSWERSGRGYEPWVAFLKVAEKAAKGYLDVSDVYLSRDTDDLVLAGLTPWQAGRLAESEISLKKLVSMTPAELEGIRGFGPAKAADVAARLGKSGFPMAGTAEPASKAEKEPVNRVSAELFALLSGYAEGHVRSSLAGRTGASGRNSLENLVTTAMVVRCKALYESMLRLTGDASVADADKVERFNELEHELVCVSPRHVATRASSWGAPKLGDFVAGDTSDFRRILDREETLIRAMEAVLLGRSIDDLDRSTDRSGKSFEPLGIAVSAATDAEMAEVEAALIDPYSGELCPRKPLRVWRIEPAGQRRAFESYCTEKGIDEKKLLWHGSKSATWMSLVTTSLKMSYANPWGMFGGGLYFANQAQKSLGYVDGGFWARGDGGGKVFLGLYDVAYGNAMKVTSSDSSLSREKLEKKGYDSVHALRGPSLRNDEIIVYRDEACCLKFLCEFAS